MNDYNQDNEYEIRIDGQTYLVSKDVYRKYLEEVNREEQRIYGYSQGKDIDHKVPIINTYLK